jgi:pilus assembly protein Flp/PilA
MRVQIHPSPTVKRRWAYATSKNWEMLSMKTFLSRFAHDESGATAIEYGLLAALIGVAIIAGAGLVGTNLNTMLNDIGAKLKVS